MKLALLPVLLALVPAMLPRALFAAEPLDGVGIASRVIGNSIDGLFGETIFFEYYALDGTIHGIGDDGPYAGAWSIEDDRMCVRFYEITDCYTLLLDGEHVDWVNDLGEVEGTGLLLPGDPRGLEGTTSAPGRGGDDPLAMPDVETAPYDDGIPE